MKLVGVDFFFLIYSKIVSSGIIFKKREGGWLDVGYWRGMMMKKRRRASVCLVMGEVKSESAVAVMVTLPNPCV